MEKLRGQANPEKRRKLSVSESDESHSKSAYEEGEFEILGAELEDGESELSEKADSESEE